MARALAEGTAGLPLVDPGPREDAIGRSTAGSIRAGIQSAIAGAARELIRRSRAAAPVPLATVAAGTGAERMRALVPEIEHVHAEATLWGLLRAVVAARGDSVA
jgi:pantothenate kinase type III